MFYMDKQPLASPSMEEEEEVEYENDWSLEKYPKMGWKLCLDCLDGNFRKSPERVLKGAGQAIGVNGGEKITKQDELTKLVKEASENMDDAEFYAYWVSLYQKRPLPPPSMEEWDNAWSLEEFARRGWTLCPDCLRGNFCERPERVVKGAGQAIVVDGGEKIVSDDELAKMIWEARENMDDKEFYPYLDSLYGRRPLAPEECDNALSPDEHWDRFYMDAHWDRFYTDEQPLASPSMEEEEEEEEEVEYENDWSLEKYPKMGWKLCLDCLDGNFCKSPERVLKGAGQAIGVNGSEKITKQDELTKLVKEASESMDDAEFYAYWVSLYQKRPLPPPSIEEWDNAWSLEEFARRGWKLCPDCLRGNFYERPERVVKGAGQAIVVNGSEKIVSDDELAKMIWEARENMDDKEFYPYLDSLYGRQPLAPEECDNASSPDEQLVRTICYRKPTRLVKDGRQAIVVNGSEKIVSDDELAKMIWEAREYMDDKEFYPYLDSLYGRRPLAPEECDNASSPDEQLVRTVGLAINTSSRRKKKKNKRKKETPSLWTLKLFKRRVTKMRSK